MANNNLWPYFKLTLFVLSLFSSQQVLAADKYWVCDNNRWDSLCWSSAASSPPIYTQPLGYDDVYLTQSDAVNRIVTYYNSAYPSAVLYSLQIDATGTGSMTLSQDLYAHNLSSINENIGINGSGIHAQSLGTNTVQNYLVLGQNTGSNGSYILSGTGSLITNNEAVGLFGYGEFTQTGGTHQSSSLFIATHAGGTYEHSGGTNTVYGNLSIRGNSTISNASYNLSGTASLIVGGTFGGGFEDIGLYGTFTQNGGTHTINGSLSIDGVYIQNGGAVAGSDLFINGVYLHNAGSNTTSDLLSIGDYAGANGQYSLSTTGDLTAATEIIGRGGTGTFNQTGGTNLVKGILYIGYYSYSSGIYNLSAGNLTVNEEHISYSFPGYYGTGTFTQTGGTHTVNNNLTIGYGGTYNLNAGTFTVGGNVARGIGSSTLNVSGGAFTVGGGSGSIDIGNLVLGAASGSNINYTLTDTGLYQGTDKVAGTLTASNLVIGKDGTGTFTQNSGTNVLTDTVTLAANNGSAGTYNLIDGALRATTITVNNGGTFNFNGGTLSVNQFNGDLANHGGTLAPGNSPGITNITGNYSQSGTGIFAVEIGGTGLGEYDNLNILGAATLDGTLNVNLFNFGSGLFAPQAGDTFDILTTQILSGQFSTLNLAVLENGLAWNISYLTDAIDTTDIVRLTVVSTVPVPPAMWLFGSGLIGLIGIARKRKFQ